LGAATHSEPVRLAYSEGGDARLLAASLPREPRTSRSWDVWPAACRRHFSAWAAAAPLPRMKASASRLTPRLMSPQALGTQSR
jgi:hypothetical protein